MGNKSRKTIVSPDGSTYVGDMKDGKPNGQGTLTYPPDGTKYIGGFKNGLPNGSGTSFFSDGTYYVGKFKNGLPIGSVTYTYPDGTNFTGNFKDGLPKNRLYLGKSGGIMERENFIDLKGCRIISINQEVKPRFFRSDKIFLTIETIKPETIFHLTPILCDSFFISIKKDNEFIIPPPDNSWITGNQFSLDLRSYFKGGFKVDMGGFRTNNDQEIPDYYRTMIVQIGKERIFPKNQIIIGPKSSKKPYSIDKFTQEHGRFNLQILYME